MPLVNMRDMLRHAYDNHYAVGGFEILNLDFLDAIVQAAEACRAPVILNLVTFHCEHYQLEYLLAAAEKAASQCSVPVALHLDHCDSLELAIRAIRLGCNSLMLDATHESFPVNVSQTRQVVDMAHACSVSVEGEVGYDNCLAPELHTHHENGHTPVEEARVLVTRTGIDCLAVSIGTHHGHVQGRNKLDFDRLKRIHEATDIPLVIHGGSGLNDEKYRKLIAQGVARINYSTALRYIAASQLRQNARQQPAVEFTGLMSGLRQAIQADVERCMRLWGSAGRAAEVLVQCEAWMPVEQVIIYNVENASDRQVEHIMSEGRRILGGIPGVRRVISGWALNDLAPYRCCWLLQFAHARVVEFYRDHPELAAFANQLFHPIAADRISIEFCAIRPETEINGRRTNILPA